MTEKELEGWKAKMDMARMMRIFGDVSYQAYTLAEKLRELEAEVGEEFPEDWIGRKVVDMIVNLDIVDETAMSVSNRFDELDHGEEL